jgi:LysR family transcriptional regulator, regulator for bpeEF and oprC
VHLGAKRMQRLAARTFRRYFRSNESPFALAQDGGARPHPRACVDRSIRDPRRYGTPTHPSDFESRHVVVSRLSAPTRRSFPLVFERDGKRFEIEGRHRVAVNESNAHLAAALAGLGIVQMPAFMLQRVAQGKLKAVMAAWQPAPLPIHVLYPPNRHLSAKVRAFVDWTAALFLRQAS